jgi:flagellar biosynthesis protein FlhA
MASALEKRFTGWSDRVQRNLDVPLILAIIGVLFTILVPLPPFLLDCLLVLNITLSMLILLTTVYVMNPLDFSAFPSILLMTTFFRLALNVATTRLILSRAGEDGAAAAGRVVEAFGEFVAGSNALVGFVIFTIIIVIQFVVITKGATRISEVAARFTLDAMPGKQLSIDADLNSGLINEEEARRRRRQVTREADFYGAMDGASKFVRGDAIAGIIITLVNIIGGLVLGYAHYRMSLGEAVGVFTRLTIGDGLVTQVPALIVSLAAGLLITRSTAEGNLGRDVLGQMVGNSKALYIASGFLLVLLPSGLPKPVLFLAAAAAAGLAFTLERTRKRTARSAAKEGEKRPEEPKVERARALLGVDPMELEIGYGLIALVDQNRGGNLLTRIGMIRDQLALDLGLVVPPIRIRDNMQLGADEYVIKIKANPVARWTVRAEHCLAMDSGVSEEPRAEKLVGTATTEPSFGLPALWIPEVEKARAEALGYTVVDITSVIATHLTEVIRQHAAELLTREEVAALLSGLKEKTPALVSEVVPEVLKAGDLQKILQNLLRERISIRDLETVLETLGDFGPKIKDPEVLTEYVRHALARAICQQHRASDGKVHAVTLDPSLEDFIQNSIEHTERGSYLSLSPEMSGGIVGQIASRIESMVGQGYSPVVLCAPQVRLQVRRMLEPKIPQAVVLSYNEIVKDVPVESHGTVLMEKTALMEKTQVA